MATLLAETVDARRVPRSVAAWSESANAADPRGRGEADDATASSRAESEDENKNKNERVLQEDADEQQQTPEAISLALARQTSCFEGFEGKRMTFLYTTQLTCANVMSTVVTARPIDTSTKRRRSSHHSGTTTPTLSNQHEPTTTATTSAHKAMHVYAQPSSLAPKKVKKKNGKYQAQLPSFHRNLPALPVPISRLNRELRDERDAFMQQLQRERHDKATLDNWAATKIQACYRGFRARPRVVSYAARTQLNTMASIRLDLSDLEHSRTSPLEGTELGDAGASSPWRRTIQSRAVKKREFRATKEHRHYAATRLQAVARGFVARCAFARRYARYVDELVGKAVVRIQCTFRAFRLRARIATVVAKLQLEAAIQIQSLIRGIQARERVLTLTFERKCEQLRRAGLPMQFTLPQRTHELVHTSCLRELFAHRKTPQQLAFKSPTWHDERQLLQIYKVSTKLNVQRQWLLRLAIVTPTARKRKKPQQQQPPSRGELTRQPSRLQARLSASNVVIAASSGVSTPTSSISNTRRRPLLSSTSPTSSRPTSPANASSRTLLLDPGTT